MTKLIVGLGNPGKEYEKTRHNVGFFVVDRLALDWGTSLDRKKFKGFFGEYVEPGGDKAILLKPQTFMNLSGECVGPWVGFLKIPGEDILVVHDEIDLPFGKIKAQWEAGPAGHNGVRSILEHLGHKSICRLRIGVGHPGRKAGVADHVLSGFTSDEMEKLEEVVQKGCEAAKTFFKKGLDPVAQIVNKRAP
jgi:PTH1 family peptidyl-tRNA hydrolase